MQGFTKPWFVCGGWAIDLHLNRLTRVHHDVDLGIFREDQLLLKEHFGKQLVYYYNEGEKYVWDGHYLELPIHEFRLEGNGLEMEFVLNEKHENLWQYRRNISITLPTDELVLTSAQGMPYLAPQVVLLFKSKKVAERDQADFENTIDKLSLAQLNWLLSALQISYNSHPWSLVLSQLINASNK